MCSLTSFSLAYCLLLREIVCYLAHPQGLLCVSKWRVGERPTSFPGSPLSLATNGGRRKRENEVKERRGFRKSLRRRSWGWDWDRYIKGAFLWEDPDRDFWSVAFLSSKSIFRSVIFRIHSKQGCAFRWHALCNFAPAVMVTDPIR